ncbi:hypothetical protein ABID21_003597 [Pseudorhizobium tarimense]|uniref:Uncharacterized protein n=1 Tax=Pseudorhizobium tarimense TaxID=1079109 RepID=A0ABV2HAA1_9HYPH
MLRCEMVTEPMSYATYASRASREAMGINE